LRLIAENFYFGPVQIAYQLEFIENVAADTAAQGLTVVPARSQAELITVSRCDITMPMRFECQFQFIPGDPEARHEPESLYRLPYASAESFKVSQAYPDQITYTDPSSQHAIDFEMPVGTGVYAARSGIVIEDARDFFSRERTSRLMDLERTLFASITTMAR